MRRTPMKKRPSVNRVIDRQASEAWAWGARSKPCAVCGVTAGVEGHHVVYQQTLRKVAQMTGLEFDRLRWDTRNRLPLCARHHQAHHVGRLRVPLEVVLEHAPKLMQFVRELDRAHDGCEPVSCFIERTYKQRMAA